MSGDLWEKLPPRFLKMKFSAWDKLDYEVRRLVVELAEQQRFRCAFCSTQSGLVIEHDHYPFQGPGHRYTVHNIRELACHRCNWHLMVYEKEQAGEYSGFENVSSYISDNEYEGYTYRYQCRG